MLNSVVEKGLVSASQCHPEKSGDVGLGMLGRFFERSFKALASGVPPTPLAALPDAPPLDLAAMRAAEPTKLAKRVVA